ncbi:MAG: hypothetical protein SNH28_06775 [Rikenellaceae bacterium]
MKRKFLSKVAFFAMATAALAFTNCSDDTDLGPVEDRLDALEQVSIPSIESQLETFELTVDAIEDLLAGFDVETVKNYIDAAILNLQGQVDTNDGDISDLQDDITDLQKQITSNDDDIADLLKKIEANEGNISDLKDDVDDLLADNIILENKVSTLEQQVEDLEALYARVDALETAKISLEASVTALENKDIELEELITALKGTDVILQSGIDDTKDYAEGVATNLAALEEAYNAFVNALSSSDIKDWDSAFGTSFTSNLESSKNTLVQWIGDELSTYWSVYFNTSNMSDAERAAYNTAMNLVIADAVADANAYTDAEIAAAKAALETAYKAYTDDAIKDLIEDLNAVVQSITLVPSTFSEVQDNTVLFKSDVPAEILYFSFTNYSTYYFAGSDKAANYSATVSYRVAPAATASEINKDNLFIKTNAITRATELAEITAVSGDATTGLITVTFDSTTKITSDESFAFAIGVNSTTDGVTTEITSDYVLAGIDYTGATDITRNLVVSNGTTTLKDGIALESKLAFNVTDTYEYLSGYDLYYAGKSFTEYGITLTKSFGNYTYSGSLASNYTATNDDVTIVTSETALIGDVFTSGNVAFAKDGVQIALSGSYTEQVTIVYAPVVVNVNTVKAPYTATWKYSTASAAIKPNVYTSGYITLATEEQAKVSSTTYSDIVSNNAAPVVATVKDANGNVVNNLGVVTLYLANNYLASITITDDLVRADSGTYTVEATYEASNGDKYTFVANIAVDGAPEVSKSVTEEITYAGLGIQRWMSFTDFWNSAWAGTYFTDEAEYYAAAHNALKAYGVTSPFIDTWSTTTNPYYEFRLDVQSEDNFKQYTQDVTLDLAGCSLTYNADFTIVNPFSAANLQKVDYYVSDAMVATTGYNISTDTYSVIAKDLSQTFKLVDLPTLENDCIIVYEKVNTSSATDLTSISNNILSWNGTIDLTVTLVAKMMAPCSVASAGTTTTNYFEIASTQFYLTVGDPVAEYFTNYGTITMSDLSTSTYNVNENLELFATTNSENKTTADIFSNTGLISDYATALGVNSNNESTEATSVLYELVDVPTDVAARLAIDANGVVTYTKSVDLIKDIECKVRVTFTYRYGSRSVVIPLTVKPL